MNSLNTLEVQLTKLIDDVRSADEVFEYDCLHEEVRDKLIIIGNAKGIEPDDVCKEESTYMTQRYSIDCVNKFEDVYRLIGDAAKRGQSLKLSPLNTFFTYSAGCFYEAATNHLIECINQLLDEVDDVEISQLLIEARNIVTEIQSLDKELDFTDNEYTRAVDALYKEVINL